MTLLTSTLHGCGGNATSNSGATSRGGAGGAGGSTSGAGGSTSGGTSTGLGGSGGTANRCTVGADQTCNDNPSVSSLWGHCEAGVCQCNPGLEVNPSTGKCRMPASSNCYSPRQNVDSAYDAGAVGCSCDVTLDDDTCRQASDGGLVTFTCKAGRWYTAEDGACELEAATVSLERSLCFGFCPVYRVTIAPDGLVSYDGRAYVRVHGAATRRIAPSAVRALADELENARYFELSVPEK